MPKNWCFELWCWKKLFNPLDWKEIQPVHPKGNQSWITTERTDAEAETIILWPPNAKNWLTGKNPDAGKDWRREEKGSTGWDGWMASLTSWTWVWDGSWWWSGQPGVLQSMGSQRIGHDWATELKPLWLDSVMACIVLFTTTCSNQLTENFSKEGPLA